VDQVVDSATELKGTQESRKSRGQRVMRVHKIKRCQSDREINVKINVDNREVVRTAHAT